MSSIKELSAAFKAAKKVYNADKKDKAAKKAWLNARKALRDAKESNNKKRSLTHEDKSPKKKAKPGSKVEELREAMKTARAAWKASDDDEELKGLFKKARLELMQYKQDIGEQTPEPEAGHGNPPSNVLWIGNLAATVTKKMVKEFLADCGTVESVRFMTHRDSGNFKGCGYVTFDSIKSATKAYKKRGEMFASRPFRADYDKPKKKKVVDREQAPPSLRLYLGNVSYDATDLALANHFRECGPMSDIHWATDPRTGHFTGYGFCTFFDQKAADKAYAMSGQEFLGRPMKVDYTKSREEDEELGPKPEGCDTVFVGRLPKKTGGKKVRQFFSDCEITSVRFNRNVDLFASCWVKFADPDDVDEAIKKNGAIMNGKKIRVDYAQPKKNLD